MPSTNFASMFRKKYAAMPDGGKKKKKNLFFPTFTKKSKGREVLAEAVNEDSSTVALSHLSSNPSSPVRGTSDSIEDPPLGTSTFDEDEDETNASSDLLLIFTSASNDTDDAPSHVLAGQSLSLSSFNDNGNIFRTPPRKTKMPQSLAPKQGNKPRTVTVAPTPTPPPKARKAMPIDLDTYDEWHDDESHWVEFLDERKDHADWEWSANSIDWGHEAPMDELAELPTTFSFEYAPKDTSDEASLDPSTASTPLSPMSFHETPTGEVEVCDPECPLRFFPNGNEDVNEEPPEGTPGYPFVGDVEDEEPVRSPSISPRPRTAPAQPKQSMFSLSYYQHQISKYKPSESREHMTKRLHNDTLALIGSVSEKLHSWDAEARSRFSSPTTQEPQPQQQQDDDDDGDDDDVSIATSASIETRKKGNTSYFSTDSFEYPSKVFEDCNFIEPFIRFGQAEV
ncbi:MAG: hypothetical protein SGBAC_004587 [Bacillariaceae sp.]